MAKGKAKATEVRFVGRCVYGCGPDHAGRLTEEHILAANFGGVFTLGEASCGACQKLINEQIEAPCLRGMFKDIRYRRGIGSRRTSGRPDELPILKPPAEEAEPLGPYLNPEHWRAKTVPYDQHPTLLVLTIYNTPGLLRGIDPSSLAKEQPGMWWYIEPHLRKEVVEGGALVQMKFNHGIFWRLIAKTAHCLAVAQFGVDGFEPFVIDTILGRDASDKRDLIGCKLPAEAPIEENNELGFAVLESGTLASHILCSVRVFADLGAPTYCAIVGKKK